MKISICSVFLLSLLTSRAEALLLRCDLIGSDGDRGRMLMVQEFNIDLDRQRVDMMLNGQAEWTFVSGSPDLFDRKGDMFSVRSDSTGIYGAGLRAGFPHSFYYNSKTRRLVWAYIWQDRVTRMEWICSN